MESSTLENKISLEVVYGTPTSQKIIEIKVDEDTSIESAIKDSGIMSIYPEIDLAVNAVGIWNRAAKLTDTVIDLDRIEIYRLYLLILKKGENVVLKKLKKKGVPTKLLAGKVKPF